MADGSARISFVWGDGMQNFRLPYAQLEELQDKTGAGPLELYNRFNNGTWRVQDLRQTIRLGLIGGGMEAEKAYALITRYVDNRPLLKNVPAASAILGVALVGADGEDEESGDGGAKKAAPEGSLAPSASPSAS